MIRLLRRRFGAVPGDRERSIRVLATAELEDLAEALLGFASPVDLKAWLVNRRDD